VGEAKIHSLAQAPHRNPSPAKKPLSKRPLDLNLVALAGTVYGLFHTFDRDERRAYPPSVASVTGHGAHLHVLCFSDVGPDTGPHPISQAELRAAFQRRGDWSVASISPDRTQARFDAHGGSAWLAKVERI
jgi:hypothetical protein